MTCLSVEFDELYERVAALVATARGEVARSVNTAMVTAYWLVGREIVEVEQQGRSRAGYGEQLLEGLAQRLTERFGRGMGVATLRRIRSFYLAYPRGSALAPLTEPVPPSISLAPFPSVLGWSHYLVLLRVPNAQARGFYEIEAAREGWSVRELERQVASLLFERLAKSRNKDELLKLAKQGQTVDSPSDVIKNPFVLEFLELQERGVWLERDLEQAIIDQLESFLLEFGKGFCFVARQKRITLDGDHFYVDLVFYNRLLSCFVLVELELELELELEREREQAEQMFRLTNVSDSPSSED